MHPTIPLLDKDIYALAQLATALATLLGVVFGFITSLRNGKKIKEIHQQNQEVKQDLYTLTGRVYVPKPKRKIDHE